MKQFFKFMFASILGFSLTIFLVVVFFIASISALVAGAENKEAPKIAQNSVLHIQFENAIQDRPSNNPFQNIDFNTFENKTPLSLKNILDNIKKAKSNDDIKGIYLDISSLQANMASIEEIRNELIDFKESGKFIVSYSENFGQGEYYLSSVADEIYLNPAGEMTFKGLSAQVMFFKDMLGRLDIDMQVIRHGKFKSAIEPFIREDMSDANREQVSTLVNTLWDHMTKQISEARNISVEKLNAIADGLLIRSANDAKQYQLIDELMYQDEVLAALKVKVGIEEDETLKKIALKKLNKVKDTKIEDSKLKINSKNRVAVIFGEGEIVSGESRDGVMGSETIARALKEARLDKKIKAIVLRVNSPGGSALASDVMWREVVLAKAEKPVIVSMGGVAASGGYYISCAADKIFAEASTITGSIGVFGLIPNMKGMFNNKLGINIDRVNTNTFSDGLTPFRPLEIKEREALKSMIEAIYSDFTQKVADGRGITQANVDSIGQGRVWTGINAKEIGLVDEIGGLNDAIAFAVETSELEDYRLQEMPAQEDPFEKMMKEFSTEVKYQILGEDIGKAEHYYRNIKSVISTRGVYTRLPVDIIID
ncbi:signal peptide peptidase SppA [Vicingaceae bacterium]|nr:signal peptide peptidase SppA [Vicingaceae bacterium]MDB4060694.1 signal peptide peptidase SppA [Vicingaceae bacterium]